MTFAGVVVGLLGVRGQAAADGAFPDSLQIFLPASRPHQIVLATNFGLIISEDDGATWEWTCEPIKDDNTILYQQAAAPSERIFAVLISHGLVYSDDAACTWTPSGGALATAIARDAFADPANPARMFAVAAEPSSSSMSPANSAFVPGSVYRSDDSGVTFGPALDTAPAGGDMLGVESAFSDPATVYLALYGTMNASNPGVLDPILARSADSGAHWTSSSLAASLGPAAFRIIAVDPTDPQRLFLRVTEAFAEKLAVSSDGGTTFTEPVSVSEQLTAFVRLADGTILLGGSSDAAPVGFRSTDRGATFQPWPQPPHLRAMAERAGKLYVAADNFLDHFAVGVSSDQGATFQPLLTFDQVKRIKPCVQAICRDVCSNLADLTLWPAQVCGQSATTPAPKGGCACRMDRGGLAAPPAGRDGLPVIVMTWAGWLVAARRRRRPR